MRGSITVSKYSPISTNRNLRVPPSSRFRLMTAWPVVPEPAKKSNTYDDQSGCSAIASANSETGFGLSMAPRSNSSIVVGNISFSAVRPLSEKYSFESQIDFGLRVGLVPVFVVARSFAYTFHLPFTNFPRKPVGFLSICHSLPLQHPSNPSSQFGSTSTEPACLVSATCPSLVLT